MLSYTWSLPMLRQFFEPRVRFPGDRWHKAVRTWPDGGSSFNMKMLLDANYHKSVVL